VGVTAIEGGFDEEAVDPVDNFGLGGNTGHGQEEGR
jgi:hypothetical protein